MATMSGLSGRVALITGGASGIGAALTRHLRAAGATVVVADLALLELLGLARHDPPPTWGRT